MTSIGRNMTALIKVSSTRQEVFVHANDARPHVNTSSGCVAIRFSAGDHEHGQMVCIFLDDPVVASLLGDELIQAADVLRRFNAEKAKLDSQFAEVKELHDGTAKSV